MFEKTPPHYTASLMSLNKRTTPHPESLQLTAQIKEFWDEMLQLDYRIWMNDFAETDEHLWQTGRRDLELLLQGLKPEDLASWQAVDIGCGVGRLLRAAAPLMKTIIGIDISPEAIALASRFTALNPNVSCILGNGTDLSPIEDASTDLVFTFGMFAHVPVVVCVSYLIEVSRILRLGAAARVQMFVGQCNPFTQSDVLAYRSYPENRLCKVFGLLGLEVTGIRDVPSDSVDEKGLLPKIYDLRKVESAAVSTPNELSEVLYPGGEPVGEPGQGSRASYIIAAQSAFKYIKLGRLEEARHMLSFAVRSYSDVDPGVINLLRILEQV